MGALNHLRFKKKKFETHESINIADGSGSFAQLFLENVKCTQISLSPKQIGRS